MGLEQFLKNQAEEIDHEIFLDAHYLYTEDTNPDAIDGEEWLEKGTSYIWKVGVLAVWDNNKFDWCNVFIAHERAPEERNFIGHLYYEQGENDDIGRCLARFTELLKPLHPVFKDN